MPKGILNLTKTDVPPIHMPNGAGGLFAQFMHDADYVAQLTMERCYAANKVRTQLDFIASEEL